MSAKKYSRPIVSMLAGLIFGAGAASADVNNSWGYGASAGYTFGREGIASVDKSISYGRTEGSLSALLSEDGDFGLGIQAERKGKVDAKVSYAALNDVRAAAMGIEKTFNLSRDKSWKAEFGAGAYWLAENSESFSGSQAGAYAEAIFTKDFDERRFWNLYSDSVHLGMLATTRGDAAGTAAVVYNVGEEDNKPYVSQNTSVGLLSAYGRTEEFAKPPVSTDPIIPPLPFDPNNTTPTRPTTPETPATPERPATPPQRPERPAEPEYPAIPPVTNPDEPEAPLPNVPGETLPPMP